MAYWPVPISNIAIRPIAACATFIRERRNTVRRVWYGITFSHSCDPMSCSCGLAVRSAGAGQAARQPCMSTRPRHIAGSLDFGGGHQRWSRKALNPLRRVGQSRGLVRPVTKPQPICWIVLPGSVLVSKAIVPASFTVVSIRRPDP
jgi:hypothetical protein